MVRILLNDGLDQDVIDLLKKDYDVVDKHYDHNELKSEINSYIKSNNLENKVELKGRVENVYEYMKNSEIFRNYSGNCWMGSGKNFFEYIGKRSV